MIVLVVEGKLEGGVEGSSNFGYKVALGWGGR